MSFSELIQWAGGADLSRDIPREEILALIREALEDLDSREDERSLEALEELVGLYNRILKHGFSLEELKQFATRFGDVVPSSTHPPDAEILEQELRRSADLLSDQEWKTPNYNRIYTSIKHSLQGDHNLLEKTIAYLERSIEMAWEPYYQTPITADEITAETVVGHLLLTEGITELLATIEILRTVPQGGDWKKALEHAERANRLLVALQNFSSRLEKETEF